MGCILVAKCFLKHVIDEKIEWRVEQQEEEEKYVSNNWMTLRRREDIDKWKKIYQIALCGELTLEELKDKTTKWMRNTWSVCCGYVEAYNIKI